jgi:hypothetical protein
MARIFFNMSMRYRCRDVTLSEVCVFCQSRYVNHVNYCLMCGRVQSSPPIIPKLKSRTPIKSPRSRRLTKEQQKLLLADIEQGIASGDLNIRDLSKKYNVSEKTVAYWKKKG